MAFYHGPIAKVPCIPAVASLSFITCLLGLRASFLILSSMRSLVHVFWYGALHDACPIGVSHSHSDLLSWPRLVPHQKSEVYSLESIASPKLWVSCFLVDWLRWSNSGLHGALQWWGPVGTTGRWHQCPTQCCFCNVFEAGSEEYTVRAVRGSGIQQGTCWKVAYCIRDFENFSACTMIRAHAPPGLRLEIHPRPTFPLGLKRAFSC